MKIKVIVKLQVEGFHYWKDAPEEVAFLRGNHRHIFHIRAEREVKHLDRDVEIITLKHEIEQYLIDKYCKIIVDARPRKCEFGEMGCEMIAEELMNPFYLDSCEVLEDNENGAIVYK